MAESTSGGATPWLAFLIGGLIVAVALIGWFVYSGQSAAPKPADMTLSVNVPKPDVPQAPKLPDLPAPTPK